MGLIERLTTDASCLGGALRTLRMTTPIAKNPTRVFPVVIEELADKFGDAPALLSDRECFTYRELAARSNRYARWALAQGVGKGDTVCLLMPNRPEFLAAVARRDAHRRRGRAPQHQSDRHCARPLHQCRRAEAHHRRGRTARAACRTRAPHITSGAELWLHGDAGAAADLPRIDRAIERLSGDTLAAADRPVLTIEDRALYIYTSGTTGLPKAANMNHYRMMLACYAFAGVMNTRATDRMYDCLPLYHTAGGLVATGALLVNGGSVVIREKFSAREFWDDVVRWDCTLFQYIGELCRYLVNSPPHPQERAHRLRLACGNGLRPDVWPDFKSRFQIPEIIEFYGATEGNVSLFNFDGKEGAVGRIPWFLANRFPTKVVRFDVELQQPVRGADGFCIECDSDEPGEVIGKILKDPSRPGARFEGYATEAETNKKILRDVFAKGDIWFRTGDLMRKDDDGYFYFVDRIGDTFRWKGENVSTTEVEEAIGQYRRRAREQCLRRAGAGPRRPRRHGGDRRQPGFEPRRSSRASGQAAAGLRAAGVPAHPQRHRGDRHLQAEKGRPRETRIRSEHNRRSDLFQRSGHQILRAPRRRALRRHPRRQGPAVSEALQTLKARFPG